MNKLYVYNIICKRLFEGKEPLQVQLMHPTYLLVQLPDGCEGYFIKMHRRKGSYTAKGNAAQQQPWVEPDTLTPRSRQRGLDKLRLVQRKAQTRTRREVWASGKHRCRRINNKMARQKTYEKKGMNGTGKGDQKNR